MRWQDLGVSYVHGVPQKILMEHAKPAAISALGRCPSSLSWLSIITELHGWNEVIWDGSGIGDELDKSMQILIEC